MTTTALVLAAGEGTRMRSDLPKVAHEILGVPLVRYVVDAARRAGCERIVVVTGHGAETVEALLFGETCVRQDEQRGTGHAVICAAPALAEVTGSLVVLSGDSPLVRPETIERLISARERAGAAAAVLTARLDDPTGYGRIVRDGTGGLAAIIEDRDLAPEQRAIDEINTGTYCFDAQTLLSVVHELDDDNAQGEFYLTDVVRLLVDAGRVVVGVEAEDAREALGVNNRVQLAEAAAVMQRRINEAHMLAGVTMIAPDLVWVAPTVRLGRDVVLEPMTFLLGETEVGDGCVIGPDSRVVDSQVWDGSVIDSSIVVGSCIGPRVTVGPRAYLRPGSVVREGAKIGTSVEIKNATVGFRSKVPHLSYIGDAEIGDDVNVGAGTITCNYDGRRKHRTVIGDGAFIGSDTMLIAPVCVGEGAVTGAGSAIAKDVPAGALGIERSELRIVEGWAKRRNATADDDEEGQ